MFSNVAFVFCLFVPVSALRGPQRASHSYRSTIHRSTATTPTSSSSSLSFVEEFSLHNFGLFDDAVVSLNSKPVFACITGETASGKSVLISALQYLCTASVSAGNTRGIFHAGGDSTVASEIELLKDGIRYKRSYVDSSSSSTGGSKGGDNTNNKTPRSSCEINGKRSAAKTLASLLKQDIRFWSTSSMHMLGNIPFVYPLNTPVHPVILAHPLTPFSFPDPLTHTSHHTLSPHPCHLTSH